MDFVFDLYLIKVCINQSLRLLNKLFMCQNKLIIVAHLGLNITKKLSKRVDLSEILQVYVNNVLKSKSSF